MKRLIPPKRVREEFCLTYELKGCQRAVDYLTKYYEIKRMKIVVDGRRVGKNFIAFYENHTAYFKRRGINKINTLHELYHHIAFIKEFSMSERKEEIEANSYARDFLKNI